MHKKTKAVAIPTKVKKAVEERDNHQCIFCGSPYTRGECHLERQNEIKKEQRLNYGS